MDDLGDPAARERILAVIDLSRAGEEHERLRALFRAELVDRRDDEYFENLYWAAFLLHLVGDPSDVPMMWQAKRLDFDTAIGFDVQFLLGAGVPATLDYLNAHGHADIATELADYPELNQDLADWLDFRRGYFYPS